MTHKIMRLIKSSEKIRSAHTPNAGQSSNAESTERESSGRLQICGETNNRVAYSGKISATAASTTKKSTLKLTTVPSIKVHLLKSAGKT